MIFEWINFIERDSEVCMVTELDISRLLSTVS